MYVHTYTTFIFHCESCRCPAISYTDTQAVIVYRSVFMLSRPFNNSADLHPLVVHKPRSDSISKIVHLWTVVHPAASDYADVAAA